MVDEKNLTTEDKLAITELLAVYDMSIDRDDIDKFLATWIEDGSLETTWGSAKGKEALRKLFVQVEPIFTKSKRHISNNIVIQGQGDTAKVDSYLTVIEAKSSPGIVATGVYTDTLKKVNGAWKFARRKLEIDPSWQPTPGS